MYSCCIEDAPPNFEHPRKGKGCSPMSSLQDQHSLFPGLSLQAGWELFLGAARFLQLCEGKVKPCWRDSESANKRFLNKREKKEENKLQPPPSLLASPHTGEALYPHILRNLRGMINPIQFNWVLS